MTTYKAEIFRLGKNEILNIGNTSKKGKMHMVKMMQNAGEEIIDFLNDCGEFEFVWNVNKKVWEFFKESGEMVAVARFEYNSEATHKKNLDYHNQRKAAHKARKN